MQHPYHKGRALMENEAQNFMLMGARGFGKALHNDEILYLKAGTKRIGDAQIGDEIYGADGKLTTITGVYPQGKVDLLTFTFRDGREVTSCKEHLWTLIKDGKEITLTTAEIAEKYYNPRTVRGKCTKDREYVYFLPKTEPIEYEQQDVSIDPYTLGILIGDGSTTHSITYTSADPEIAEYIPYKVTKHKSKYSYGVLGIKERVKNLGLNCKAEHKFIPWQYLYSSVEQRLELLRGLMDTDGSVDTSGSVEYSTSSEKLKDDVLTLLRSLGIIASSLARETTHLPS